MVSETEQIRETRLDLRMFSASDPVVSSTLLRYAAAFSLTLTGRCGRERRDGERQTLVGKPPSP
ncbi:MAG TPA: hypothetical protein VF592_00310 [Sphingomonas sp.]|jgi:hypothetical protein|uniref:hypothetical protein n=1 Tax=Sphingomonas sp. TaxID=28214 RepID=UPI002ED93277